MTGIIEVTERGDEENRSVLIPLSSISLVVDLGEKGALIRVAPNVMIRTVESYKAIEAALANAAHGITGILRASEYEGRD